MKTPSCLSENKHQKSTFSLINRLSSHFRRSCRMLPSLIIVLTLTTCTYGENPAVQLLFTDKGLQYGKHVGAGWIQDNLKHFSLPDIKGRILGVSYMLSDITISQCDFPEPSVEFSDDVNGFTSSLSGLSVAIKGNWATQCRWIRGGTFDLALFDLDVMSVVELGKDADGHLSVTSNKCRARVGDLMIQLHGASWFLKHFVDFFKNHIKGELQSKICPCVEKFIVNLEDHLKATNVSFEVCKALGVDLPLTSPPLINASALNLGLKGEFYSIKTHEDPPFEAPPFSLPEQPDYMMSVGVSAYTLNSASFAFYSAGLLQVLINDSMIPPGFPFRLNTSSFGHFIPQLPKLFPDLLMELQVYARDIPMFYFLPGAVKLNFLAAVKAFAIQPNSTWTPLFKLNADSEFSGKVWISDGKVKGSVAMDNFTLTLAASEIGTFKTDHLEDLAKMGLKMALSQLNQKLAKGFDLPRMKHGELVNTVLNVEKGFMAISSDAELWSADRRF
ncbi:hypothetical protein LDENG_00209060 [Lucifuga dentata]|nr:hypothetical protein LDENG_00209060 [Lucifuga dentata]